MKDNEKQFYLVDFQILPEAIKKTIRVKEMLKDGTKGTVNEAVTAMNMSRSAYYKYKDHVEPADHVPKEKMVIFFLVMQNDFALLNKVIKKITKESNVILTINRGYPFQKHVPVTITFKTTDSTKFISDLADSVRKIKGIKSVDSKEEGT